MDPQPTLPARPDPFPWHPQQTALLVIDMQNAYASKGGYVDYLGNDLSAVPGIVTRIQQVVALARQWSWPIIFTQNGWDPDLREAGGPGSPNWYKSNALKLMRQRPELTGSLLIKGTWDYDFIDALRPQPTDYLLQKTRYSSFCGTNLDMILRQNGIRHLILTGIASNVCVETTIRDAFSREYFCLLLEDCTAPVGDDAIQAASLFNIEKFFGWVSDSATLIDTLSAGIPIP
ncbi:MAG: pyrimidine utilization protein B [Synechococcales cyanobacterium]